jgi:hypothetical protein
VGRNRLRRRSSSPEHPPGADPHRSCPATSVSGSAPLSFVISTGEVMGLRPPKVMAPVQSLEAPPSPLSSRPKRSAVERSAVQRLFPGYVFRQRVADFLVRAAGNEHSVRHSVKRASCRRSKPPISTGNPEERSGEMTKGRVVMVRGGGLVMGKTADLSTSLPRISCEGP